MKINIDDSKVIEVFPYLEVGSKLKANTEEPEVLHKNLPIFLGDITVSNTDLDFLIVTSDLQGIAEANGNQYLLGELLPSFLRTLIDIEFFENAKVGVLLCGDLYTSLEKRGASGDVRSVWNQFNDSFEWVAGVAGNHDSFGSDKEKTQFESTEGIHFLHNSTVLLNGIKLGGLGGIIGRSDKLNRLDESDYLEKLSKLTKKELDVILLHETPDFPSLNQIGNARIREVLESGSESTVCCGHCHWEKTSVLLNNNAQVLNVDAKVLLLKIQNK